MSSWTRVACPVDGARLVQVSSTNVAGDAIQRWECPLGDWSGPWYTGLDTDEIHQIPEVSRSTDFTAQAGSSGSVTQTGRDDTDNQAAASTGLLTGVSRLYGWDSIGGNWDRIRVNAAGEVVVTTAAGSPTGRDDTDNQAAVATGLGTNVSRNYIWDGANWDRWTGAVTGPLTDAQLRAAPVPISGTVTVTDGAGPLTVDGTVEIGAASLAALESITVQNAGGASAVNIQDGGNSITVDGTVELGATSLAALETVTVNQGTSPWVIGDGGGSITVDGTVTITDGSGPVTVDGTVELGATSLAALETITAISAAERAEDSAHSTGQTGLFILGVRNDAGTSLVDTTGDYAPLQVNAAGELRVTTAGGTPTGRDDTDDQAAVATGLSTVVNRLYLWDGTNWDRAKSAGSTGVLAVGGAAAHDTASAGNPVLIGSHAVAENGTVTSVTAADVTRALADLKGRQYVTAKRPALLGIYHAVCPQSTITVGADAATAGRHWLINPVGSGVLVAIRRIDIISESSTALVTLTTPLIQYERVTFTGTASGAQVTPARRDSTDAAPTATIRTASTGLTLSAGAAICALNVHSVLTAVGETRPVPHTWIWAEEERIVLRAGEGVVLRQASAGTAADTRIFQADLIWEEYTA